MQKMAFDFKSGKTRKTRCCTTVRDSEGQHKVGEWSSGQWIVEKIWFE